MLPACEGALKAGRTREAAPGGSATRSGPCGRRGDDVWQRALQPDRRRHRSTGLSGDRAGRCGGRTAVGGRPSSSWRWAGRGCARSPGGSGGRCCAWRLVFATMNLSLYTAIDRIGLGLAVTLEFLGPLAVALAASRRLVDLLCALVAGAAVVLLARPQPTTDYAGHRARPARRRVLGVLHPAQPHRRRPPAGRRGLGRRRRRLRPAVPARRHHRARPPPADRERPGLRGGRRRPLLGRAVPRRPARPAPGPRPLLRRLHERQPRPRGTGRPVVLDQTLHGIEWLAIAAIVAANTVSILAAGSRTTAPPAAGPGAGRSPRLGWSGHGDGSRWRLIRSRRSEPADRPDRARCEARRRETSASGL